MQRHLEMLEQYPIGHPLLFYYLDLVVNELSDQTNQVLSQQWNSAAERTDALTLLRDYRDFNKLAGRVRDELFMLDLSVNFAGLASAATDVMACNITVESCDILPSDHDLLSAVTTVLMSGSELELPNDTAALYDFAGEVLCRVAGVDCVAQGRHTVLGMVHHARVHWPNVSEFISTPNPSPSAVLALLKEFRDFLTPPKK